MPHPSPFTAEIVEAIRRHMNDEHAEDTLLIAQRLGGLVDACRARVADLDPAGLTIEVDTSAGARLSSRIAWPRTPEDRADIRHQIVELHSMASDV